LFSTSAATEEASVDDGTESGDEAEVVELTVTDDESTTKMTTRKIGGTTAKAATTAKVAKSAKATEVATTAKAAQTTAKSAGRAATTSKAATTGKSAK
jgi:hypothetical protein